MNLALQDLLLDTPHGTMTLVTIRMTTTATGGRDLAAVDLGTFALRGININLPMCDWASTNQCMDFELFCNEGEMWLAPKGIIRT